MNRQTKPLFIFEMANNHQGSTAHGLRILREFKEVCRPYEEKFAFAFKFQYRDLDTFIRPGYADRCDIKNIKRFQETRLSQQEYQTLLTEAKEQGFLAICTPFDEISAERIKSHGYDMIKIASCSFADWPLMEKIAQTGLPVIASTAASSLEDIRRVHAFFKHRNLEISLLHCVAEYPAPEAHLELNQIDLLKKEFPDVRVGFSTHEDPEEDIPVRLAVAKGAEIFEKHVGLAAEGISLNGYSATPAQAGRWLEAAASAFAACGIKGQRYRPSGKEISDLEALRRGVFVRETVQAGTVLEEKEVFFAFPCEKGQLSSGAFSKYNRIKAAEGIEKGQAVHFSQVEIVNTRQEIESNVRKVLRELKKSGVILPKSFTCDLSHHYGIERYAQCGVAIIDCINREYCKKILVLLPGQKHPVHLHRKKEETFTVLSGDMCVEVEGGEGVMKAGDSKVVERGKRHSFSSEKGCVFEEISTTHYAEDSFYEREQEFVTPRKTRIYLTKEMIEGMEAP